MTSTLKFFFLSLLFIPSALFAIGDGEAGAGNEIPLPPKNFSAEVTDVTGQSFKARRVSLEGKTYLAGRMGKAKVTVPFDNIAEITVRKTDEPTKVRVEITLKTGGSVNAALNADASAYGETDFGKFEIIVADLAKLKFSQP